MILTVLKKSLKFCALFLVFFALAPVSFGNPLGSLSAPIEIRPPKMPE